MKDDNTPAAEENGQPERETEDEDGIRTNYAAFMRMEQSGFSFSLNSGAKTCSA